MKMTLSQIERGTLQLARNIIYIPSNLKKKVITYSRRYQIERLPIKDLTKKEQKDIVNMNFVSY
tara:strand:- start:4601 stop:4792 length:192 start_codon:yes stop_codon:yes gene_type:complete